MLLLLLTIFCTCSVVAHTQESSKTFLGADESTVDFGEEPIKVSEEQFDRISEIEDQFMSESESYDAMEMQVEDLKARIAARIQDFETKKLSVLTAEQKETLSAQRFQAGDAKLREQQASDRQHLRILLPILDKLQKRQPMTVLEGPQRKSMKLPTAPADDQSVEHVGDHFFFKEPLILNREDELSILSTICNYRSYLAFSGGKFCGGFHPDVNVRIVTEGGTIQFLVCFGCGEVLILDGEQRVLADIESNAHKSLQTVFLRNARRRDPARKGVFK